MNYKQPVPLITSPQQKQEQFMHMLKDKVFALLASRLNGDVKVRTGDEKTKLVEDTAEYVLLVSNLRIDLVENKNQTKAN